MVVKDSTPEEAWKGKKPYVHYFKIFGCIAYAHVPESQRRKLDNRSAKCVVLGVSEESKAYKLFDPMTRKVIVSRDVVFDEAKKWNWEEKTDKASGELIELDEKEEGENVEGSKTVAPSSSNGVTSAPNDHSGASSSNHHTDSEPSAPESGDGNQNQGRRRRKPAYLEDLCHWILSKIWSRSRF